MAERSEPGDHAAPEAHPADALVARQSAERLQAMRVAGGEASECLRVLEAASLNLVGEVLRDSETFYELEHYPRDDVFDALSHSQYYYHSHRTAPGEHGHFHTFLRQPGMPHGMLPVAHRGAEAWPAGQDALTHLVAISMDPWGRPLGMFTVNRWVTAEAWYRADDVIAALARFRIDHAAPSWPLNRWITAMLQLFAPQIEWLIRRRDEVVLEWARTHPGGDVYEDRELEVTSEIGISIDEQMHRVRRALES